jgi:transcriptional regulator with XRE-family HTH domain
VARAGLDPCREVRRVPGRQARREEHIAIDKRRLQFGDRLRELRKQAGFATGKAFAEHISWVASKVSRLENGQQMPSDADVQAWLAAVNASASEAAAVRDELLELRLEQDSWRRQLRTGHTRRQEYSADIERDARSIIFVEFYLVPGLVQTAEYARAVFTAGAELLQTPRDTEEAVRARMKRQEVLYDPSKQIEILLAEAALRYPISSPTVMAAQLDRLQGLAGIEHVRLGVIPLNTQLSAVPMHGYVIVDDLVLVEVTHTELTAVDPADVALYRRLTAKLWDAAVEGEAARRILVQLSRELADG